MQTTFLQSVASDLYSRYGNDIQHLNIVFPSRRGRIFFTLALGKLIKTPIWQPNYMGMDDVVKSLSTLQQLDNYSLLVQLYKGYSLYRKTNETFDQFYFWGEILLKDFDTIDKYLVNAKKLFTNLLEQKAFEGDFSFLLPEQVEYIQSFWSSFNPTEPSDLQQQFIDVWEVLYAIYSDFRQQLSDRGEAYEGMLYREMADNIAESKTEGLAEGNYVFVGFNALNECEKKLFSYLQKAKRAEFYWDYDPYYIDNPMQEAGWFMRSNLRDYPAPKSFDVASDFSGKKNITITSIPSVVLQAKMLPTLLQNMNAPLNQETAIILADENLLLPALHSLPSDVEDVNITMGYPLQQTPVYALAELLIRLQRGCKVKDERVTFYHKDVVSILNHQYIKLIASTESEQYKKTILQSNLIYISPDFFKANVFLHRIFSSVDNYADMSGYLIDIFTTIAQVNSPDQDDENALRREYIFYLVKALNQLKKSIDTGALPIGMPVFLSLLRNVFVGLRIPFTGEPIRGLQIMGFLETRSLDFDNLIILSMNEGVLPHTGTTPSFVPYHLRQGFGLPTAEQQEAIYAYYFYRLLQRASNVQLVYSSKTDEVRTGEMSRYLYQLKFESEHDIQEQNLGYQISFEDIEPIVIEKTGEVAEILQTYIAENSERRLSPSALSSFITCPMQFYFRYIARLSESVEVTEELAANVFGSILHGTMERLYAPYLDKTLMREAVMAMYDNTAEIYRLLDEGFAREFYRSDALPPDFADNGKLLLTRDVIAKYVRGILLFDARHAPFTPLGFEQRITLLHHFIQNDGTNATIKLSGIADRIDRYQAAIRIIDYKTGSGKGKEKRLKFKGVESLFAVNPDARNSEAFQTFLYSYMYLGSTGKQQRILPTLYFVRDMYYRDFTALLTDELNKTDVDDFNPYLLDFELFLNQCLGRLFDLNEPFTQTEYVDTCTKACAFNTICQRK